MAYVYIIKAEGMLMYKIGISNTADARLKTLQAGSPIQLSIAHVVWCENARQTESQLHTLFASQRSHHEWFSLSDEDVLRAKEVMNNAMPQKAQPIIREVPPPAKSDFRLFETDESLPLGQVYDPIVEFRLGTAFINGETD